MENKVRNIQDTFTERLNFCVEKLGNPSILAKRTNISRPTIGDYLSGKSDPSRQRVIDIATAAGVSIAWLVSGEGSPDGQKSYGFSDQEQQKFAPPGRTLAPVPVMNIVASAGNGSVILDEKEAGFIGFSREWLHQNGLSPAELFSMPTIGESMEPTIKAGEYLLCSMAEHHLKPGDGIYVVRLEGDILVKRLQRLPGGVLQVSSDNTTFYKAFNVTVNDGVDFCILGKVVIVHGARRV